MARWLKGMAEFNYEVIHRPGKQHFNADALSRDSVVNVGWILVALSLRKRKKS